jgi:hypothetical protein
MPATASPWLFPVAHLALFTSANVESCRLPTTATITTVAAVAHLSRIFLSKPTETASEVEAPMIESETATEKLLKRIILVETKIEIDKEKETGSGIRVEVVTATGDRNDLEMGTGKETGTSLE